MNIVKPLVYGITKSTIQGQASINYLESWDNKVAADQDRLRIIPFGASVTEGAFADNFLERWAELISINSNTLRGDGGKYEGFISSRYITSDPLWTYPSGKTYQSIFGPGSKNTALLDGQTANLAGTVPFDHLTVLYAKGFNSGEFSITIDSEDPVVIDGYDEGLVGTRQEVFSGLNEQSHSITMTSPSGAYSFLEGVLGQSGSRGVQTINAGHGGYRAIDYLSGTRLPYVRDMFSSLQPDVIVIYDLGLNEYTGSTTPRTTTQFKADMSSLLDVLKEETNNAPILLCIPHEIGIISGTPEPWEAWVEAYKQIAKNNSTEILDIGTTLGTFVGGTNPYDSGDTIHPNSAGHAIIEQMIRDRLFQMHPE